ncbi:MAG: transcription termination factor NusA [Candidatus Omnitrophica bacterium]|nr:transcription termination factor NusA [Candidatus Omnitrophota bacterium]MBU1933219.1 transcription termination factor NusA [Candidatus Omnitrophota bacterium]
MSAARKKLGKHIMDIKVEFDQETGEFKVFGPDGNELSGDFGRISAQTAKQVIIQKIREAERDVVFDEYQRKINDIATGSVHRFEKGMLIVDLGRAEGVMPRRELPANEQYRQGDRIKALIIDVKKTPKGPEIMLSRTNPGLVKRFFEIEVPEIYEGIVDIKSVSREAGNRSKIAVYSKDDKVDPVGACVGMRGQRVKNIVRELGGEKIDIIRWSVNTGEFISSSLSPAEISSVKLNEEEKRAEVIVADDQLSLAIGKKGQNVRLAAKLTGWNIDIRSKSEIEKLKDIAINELDGVGPKTEKVLKKAGFKTIGDISKADLKELTRVEGIGKKTAEKILKSAKALMEQKVHEVRDKKNRERKEENKQAEQKGGEADK